MKKLLKLIIIFVFLITTVLVSKSLVLQTQAATIAELQSQIQVLLDQIQQLQNQITEIQGQKPAPAPIPPGIFVRNLTIGSRGDDVKTLQQFLKDQGQAIYPEGLVTGYFGSATQGALANYQIKAGIYPAEGYFGSKTREYLASGGGPLLSGSGTPNLPDLIVKSVTLSPQKSVYSKNDNVNLSATFKNIGLSDSGAFAYNVRNKTNNYLIELSTSSLSPNQEKNYDLTPGFNFLTILADGLNGIEITVDYDGVVTESNETNNTYPFNIQVGTPTTNQAPIISSISGPTTLGINQAGTWTVNATDPEGKALQYTVNWGDGSATSAKQSSPTFSHTYMTPKIYSPTFTAYDEQGLSASRAYTVRVGSTTNQPPVIEYFSGPASITVNQSSSWSILAFDVENEAPKCVVNWGDGSATSTAYCYRRYTVSFIHTYTQTGSYNLIFTVYDDSGLTATKTATVKVQSPKPPGLMGYYHFDENYVGWMMAEPQPVYDSSPYKNHGTAFTKLSVTDGIRGKAYYFDGNIKDNDYIRIDNKGILADFDDFTIEVWVKPKSIGKSMVVLWSRPLIAFGKDPRYTSGLYPQCIYVQFNDYHEFRSNFCDFKNNEWYHLAFVRVGTELKLYIDGKLDKTYNTGGTNPYTFSSELDVGLSRFSSNYDFVGVIDELKIYNYAKNNFDTDKTIAYKEEVNEALNCQSGLQSKEDLYTSLESTTIPGCWMNCTWINQRHFKRCCSPGECLYNTNCYANGAAVNNGKYVCTNGEWKSQISSSSGGNLTASVIESFQSQLNSIFEKIKIISEQLK